MKEILRSVADMSVLRVENLSKRYGKKQALKGITCEFRTGINALLGPNGAGKTTIMTVSYTHLTLPTTERV